jgi:hypothetical protein
VVRRRDADPNLVRPNTHDSDANIAIDENFFTGAPCENEHACPSMSKYNRPSA